MASIHAIRDTIDQTPFVDTHEHLLEERTRLSGIGTHRLLPCDDAALLFHHYAGDDLASAGMTGAERERFFGRDLGPEEKWALLAPYWPRVRHTGYVQAVRRSIRTLFGVDELGAAAFAEVTERMRERARPGLYRDVLARAGVESCQVNSLEAISCETEQPDLLMQDLSLLAYTTALDLPAIERAAGSSPRTLGEMEAAQGWFFDRYAARAVAVKSQAAYARRLDYADVPRDVAGPLFERLARGERLTPADRKAVEDYLMRRAIGLATRHRLPVKLHCGYYAGYGRMPLERVRRNAGDLCPLLADFPDTTFVLMHIGYPYQDEFIALAKHYPNAHVDLCWAWIINPAATARFVAEFLVAAPASKLFTFGGDYANVEPVVGHAEIARQGLAQALERLVEDGWLSPEEALDLVEPLMRGNARRVFRLDERLPSAPSPAAVAAR